MLYSATLGGDLPITLGAGRITYHQWRSDHGAVRCDVWGCWRTNVGELTGGNDILTYTGGGQFDPNPFNGIYGDAKTIIDKAHGGDDILQMNGLATGSFTLSLYGDAHSMSGRAVGGNDTLVGGLINNDALIGDAHDMHDNAVAGNDVLISRGANDQMWGDGVVMDATVTRGNNTFVFAPMNGHDTINAFLTGNDHIDLTA